MKKWDVEVQQSLLASEAETIKELEKQYNLAMKDILDKTKILQSEIDALDDAIIDAFASNGDVPQLLSQKQSKIYQKQYQDALKTQVGDILDKLHTQQYNSIQGYLNDCYEQGYVGTMYSIQNQLGVSFVMPIDQTAVTRAVLLNSKIKEGYYQHLGVDYDKLKKIIPIELSRGIASNQAWSDIARNIDNASSSGINNAIRIARTEGHRIQQQGTNDAQFKAKDAGADVLKQWDAALDGRTRDSHRMVDGQILELKDEKGKETKFSNGLRFPGDPSGGAAEVINCRCACLTRARWALDDDELNELKDRAKFHEPYIQHTGDPDKITAYQTIKSKNFDDYINKFSVAAQKVQAAQIAAAAPPKKEYLTEKKLGEKIDDISKQEASMLANYADVDDFLKNAPKSQVDAYNDLIKQKADYQDKLNKKITAKQKKVLTKEQADLENQINGTQVKIYSGIWKNADVTTDQWDQYKDSIPKKKKYYEGKILNATDVAEMQKYQDYINLLDEFDAEGKALFDLNTKLTKVKADLKNLLNGGIIQSPGNINPGNPLFANGNPFTDARKNSALWFTKSNGGAMGADKVARPVAGKVWQGLTTDQKQALYDYTHTYARINEPLRGIEYGTSRFLGVGNVDLDLIGTNYRGFAKGFVRKLINDMTDAIEQSTYQEDWWFNRGVTESGFSKLFGFDEAILNKSQAEIEQALLGLTGTEYGFMSVGVAKGSGFTRNVTMNVYAPSGTKMMYLEPFSQYGHGTKGISWDGKSTQSSIGYEAEMLLQQGTELRITKVEKNNYQLYVDVEVIGQGVPQR